MKSITQADAPLIPSNYQITEQIWRHTCVETTIENSKNTSWGRNLTYRHMYLWGCTGTALSEFCQLKILFTVRGERNFYFDIYCQQEFSVLAAVFAHTVYVWCLQWSLLYTLMSRHRNTNASKGGKIPYHGTKYTCSFCVWVFVGILLTSIMTTGCLPSLFSIWWDHDACYNFCLNINTLRDGKPCGQVINLEAQKEFYFYAYLCHQEKIGLILLYSHNSHGLCWLLLLFSCFLFRTLLYSFNYLG